MSVAISNTVDLGAFKFTLAYDPAVVEVLVTTLGPFPGSSGRTVNPVGPNIDNGAGSVTFGAYSLGFTPPGPDGDGVLALLTLRALTEGTSNLAFTAALVTDRVGNPQSVSLQDGLVSVGSASTPTPTPMTTPTPFVVTTYEP